MTQDETFIAKDMQMFCGKTEKKMSYDSTRKKEVNLPLIIDESIDDNLVQKFTL